MQWTLGIVWGAWVAWGSHRHMRAVRLSMALGLAASMATQLVLLQLDGLLTLETALPLHLCGLFGVVSIPLLWYGRGPLWEASAYLAGPAAFVTLFFPAVMNCSHPVLMELAFAQLHVLVALTPVFLYRTGKPLPLHPRRTLVLGNGYLLFVGAFNCAFDTNYLFLRAAPAGTPLAWLFQHGTLLYVCALEVLCMTVFACLQGFYCRVMDRRAVLSPGNS